MTSIVKSCGKLREDILPKISLFSVCMCLCARVKFESHQIAFCFHHHMNAVHWLTEKFFRINTICILFAVILFLSILQGNLFIIGESI